MESQIPLNSRSSLAAGAAAERLQRSTVEKSWIAHGGSPTAKADAREANVREADAVKMVTAVTRFATAMCVVVAVLKVGVYLYSQAAVVKTSCLDSMGDLVANGISLYTNHRMSTVDLVNFPAGQGRFEPIGVSVFSTLMASAMFANLLNNIEAMIGGAELSRADAVRNFMDASFSMSHHKVEDVDNLMDWHDPEKGWRALKNGIQKGYGDWAGQIPTFHEEVTMTAEHYHDVEKHAQWWIHTCSELEDPFQKWHKVFFTSCFLCCTATYKLCLFIFCKKVAIPRTGSTVLMALANDKFNDFVSTTTVVLVMLGTYFLAEQWQLISNDVAEKIDPLASAVISVLIIRTWVVLLKEQVVLLSGLRANQDIVEALQKTCLELTAGAVCDIASIKCYHSSQRYTVEIELWVNDARTSFSEVNEVMAKLTLAVSSMEDIERVLIFPSPIVSTA